MGEAVDDVNEQSSDAPVDAGWRSAIAANMGEVEPSAPAEPEAVEAAPAPTEEPEQEERDDTASTEATAQKDVQREAQKLARKEAKREAMLRNGPGSWRASAKAKWSTLDPEVKEEILRRERDMSVSVAAHHKEREFAETIRKQIEPYEPLIRQAGISAPQAVSGLLQREHTLLTAPIHVRASVLAQGIRQYLGVDENAIMLLAQALDGGQGGAMPQAPPSPPPPSREQIEGFVRQQVEARTAQANEAEAIHAIQQFEATRPEHLATVIQEMAAFLQVEEARGRTRFGLDDIRRAYDFAIVANPHARAIEKRKEEAAAAAATNAATKKAKSSAVSVKSTPSGPRSSEPLGDDWGSHLRASMDALDRH